MWRHRRDSNQYRIKDISSLPENELAEILSELGAFVTMPRLFGKHTFKETKF